mmetsp:Transcript_62857/g.112082  ORF Transcript_62857/g.112082 Transcript_62857/m.112082 type:complete len:281 (+) Transcript_62857:586-1428(+)
MQHPQRTPTSARTKNPLSGNQPEGLGCPEERGSEEHGLPGMLIPCECRHCGATPGDMVWPGTAAAALRGAAGATGDARAGAAGTPAKHRKPMPGGGAKTGPGAKADLRGAGESAAHAMRGMAPPALSTNLPGYRLPRGSGPRGIESHGVGCPWGYTVRGRTRLLGAGQVLACRGGSGWSVCRGPESPQPGGGLGAWRRAQPRTLDIASPTTLVQILNVLAVGVLLPVPLVEVLELCKILPLGDERAQGGWILPAAVPTAGGVADAVGRVSHPILGLFGDI